MYIQIRELWNEKNQFNRYVLAIENDAAFLGDGFTNGVSFRLLVNLTWKH
jgi:hypothetical protein